MKKATFLLVGIFAASVAAAETGVDAHTLDQTIRYGLEHNARVRSSRTDIEIERSGIRAAQADRMPRLDLYGGVTKYHYPTAAEPLYGTPPDIHYPSAFYTTVYDAGVTFSLPLYRGGRLSRSVEIAEIRKSIAEDLYSMTRQELVYNLTSAYYKILQIEKFSGANDETVKQLEAHKRDVELLLRAGTVAKVDLLKTETELAHARQAALISRNNLESAYELLRVLMGIEDMHKKIKLAPDPGAVKSYASVDESMQSALRKRPDYQVALKKVTIADVRVKVAAGRRYPSLNLTGDYSEKSGPEYEWQENWFFGLRLSLPLFEGGALSADVGRARAEALKAREEERALRLDISREVRDAYLSIENAAKRIEVAEKAIASAKESARIEQIRYKAGAGTSTDVIDAQTALLRAETDYYQALYDKAIARALLRKAAGEELQE